MAEALCWAELWWGSDWDGEEPIHEGPPYTSEQKAAQRARTAAAEEACKRERQARGV